MISSALKLAIELAKQSPKFVKVIGNSNKLLRIADKAKYAGKYRSDIDFIIRRLLDKK